MVQPPATATAMSPHSLRSFSSTISALYTHFISIPYYFIGVLNFCRAAWRLLGDLRAFIRKWTSRKARRRLRIVISHLKHEPDILILSGTYCFQFVIAFYLFVCVLASHLLSVIPYKPFRVARWRLDKHFAAVWNRQIIFLNWVRVTPNADVILYLHEFKDKVARRLRRRVSKAFYAFVHMILPETIARKVLQFASILAVWQKTSLDHVRERNGPSKPAALPLQAGFIRVRLAFPTLIRSDRANDPWGLSKQYSIIDDFMVEPDGSLDLTKVMARWDLEAISILDPNRFQPFETSQPNRLSPLAIQVLTERDNQVTIIEERYFLRKRVQLRQDLLASRLYFLIRVVVRLLIFASVGYAVYQTRRFRYAAPPLVALVLFIVYDDVCFQNKSGIWRTGECVWSDSLPARYPESYINPENELFCLWMGTGMVVWNCEEDLGIEESGVDAGEQRFFNA